jgi:DDE family transposase
MIERVEQRFDLKPDRLIGDTAYGTGPLLAWLVQDKQLEPHIPVWDKADRQDGTLSRSEFNFDADQDRYTCPAGKPLRTTGRPTADNVKLYRASVSDCQACSLKPKCCPNTPARKIPRSIHEASREAARELANTDVYRQSRKDRKKVEILFAHLKRILRLGRLRLRGRTGARDEFLLAATAQNLRRMAKWLIPKTPQTNPALA